MQPNKILDVTKIERLDNSFRLHLGQPHEVGATNNQVVVPTLTYVYHEDGTKIEANGTLYLDKRSERAKNEFTKSEAERESRLASLPTAGLSRSSSTVAAAVTAGNSKEIVPMPKLPESAEVAGEAGARAAEDIVKADAETNKPKAAKKKPAAKKAPAKAAKKTAVKPAAKKAEKKDGLRLPQVRILKALAKNSKGLTRSQISEKAEVDPAMGNYLGPSDPAHYAAASKKYGFPSLCTLGYVKAQLDKEESGKTIYHITASGSKALEKANS